MIIYNVFIDGTSTEKNICKCSYGVVVKGGRTVKQFKGAFEPTTVNRMFLMGAIFALEAIAAMHEFDEEMITVHIHSRSRYLVDTMNYKLTKGKNTDLWEKLDRALTGTKAYWHLIELPTSSKEIDEVQECARDALKMVARKDRGYNSSNISQSNQEPASFLGYKVKVSSEMENASSFVLDIDSYCKKFLVNKKCARDIITFYRSNKKLVNDYASLKTYGQDWWSKEINEITYSQYHFVSEIGKYVKKDQDVLACVRWHKRGLSLTDSIYKVLIDARIWDMAKKNGYGNHD